MEISSDSSYLTVIYDPSSRKYRVIIFSDLPRALVEWTCASRISPIFKIKKFGLAPDEPWEPPKKYCLFFLGPVLPVALSEIGSKASSGWLTLGLFNIVLVVEDRKNRDQIVKWAKKRSFRYEYWDISDGIVGRKNSSKNSEIKDGWFKDLSDVAKIEVPNHLKESKNEYCPLMATTLARANQSIPQIIPSLLQAHKDIKDLLYNANKPDLLTQFEVNGIVVKTNAGLSRFSSQAFSGSKPILGTECHYWTHSLLGTGVANLALLNVFDFVRERLGKFNIPARLEAMDKGNPFAIERINGRDDFWQRDHLSEVDLAGKESSNEEPFPLFACFSGRDGFRSTETTLSAPLAAVTGCNSVLWNLLTLTHEMSHVFIRGCLGVICPRADDVQEMKKSVELLQNEAKIVTWQDALKRMWLLCAIEIFQARNDMQVKDVDKDGVLAKILQDIFDKTEEIMVHVFDFLYFYGQKIDNYSKSIWLSWSVIPNISHRVPEYVLRSLCAIMVKYLRKKNGVDLAYRQLKAILKKLKTDNPELPYIREGYVYLVKEWDPRIKDLLVSHVPLIALVRGFLYSYEAAGKLLKETRVAGKQADTEGYNKRRLDLDDKIIDNPLWFLNAYATDDQPSMNRSLWILYNLAFNLQCQTS